MSAIAKQDHAVAGAPVAQLGRYRRKEAPESRQQTVQVLPDTEGRFKLLRKHSLSQIKSRNK